MAALMVAKKSMKFHRMYLLKGRFINSYILFTALRKVVSKEYMKAGKDAMTATTEEHLGKMQTVMAKPARTTPVRSQHIIGAKPFSTTKSKQSTRRFRRSRRSFPLSSCCWIQAL